jgi:Xaa-Pro aminopeptidase
VHEGPNGISKAYTEPLPLHSINSIEPGYYVPDWGGIRLENLALVIEAPSLSLQAGTPQPTWYAFELLNWIPFASHLIDPQWLSPQEKQWLVDYHQAILKRLTPRLLEKDSAALAWLEQSCQSCRRVLS